MYRIAALCLAGLAAVSCAPTLIDADEKGGVVESRSSLPIGIVGVEIGTLSERQRQIALERADQHCARFGKHARIVIRGDNAMQFECVGDGTGPKS